GWLIQRFGLAASTSLQPATVLLFSIWSAIAGGSGLVLAMRWFQGVVFQTLGKSSAEIYYAAIPADERRAGKPSPGTLVERWSDAVVGVLLILLLDALGASLRWIAFGTGALAAVWLVLLLV